MREGNALIVEGEMLSNDHADDIVSAADEGLEWQMSVHIESRRTLTRHAGDVVNGQALADDDVLVLSDGVIREVSFTPTGVDANTSARILSLSLKPDKEQPVNTEQQIAALTAEKAALTAENETLKQQLAEQARAAKLAQLSALGVEGERAAKLAKADDDTFVALVEQIQLSAKQSAVLSASYEGGTTETTRQNPLLKNKE